MQRKKPGADVSAYFYTIVSEGTDEVGYSDRYRATPSCRLALVGVGGAQLTNSFIYLAVWCRRREFMEEHGYLYHEYDYKHFMHAETEEFTRDSKQDVHGPLSPPLPIPVMTP